jgi:CRP-like cAMP-binding protein
MSPSATIDEITPDLRRSLEEVYLGHSIYSFRRGQSIPLHKGEVWLVGRGLVQLSTVDQVGFDIFTGFAGSGMPFGLPLTTLDPYHALSLSDVHLLRFSMAEIERSPDLCHRLFTQVTRRLQQSELIVTLISQRRIEDRLRELLLLLKQEAGQPVEGGVKINIRLTHQHLATAINSTRVTVTRVLKQLQAEGWLKIDRERFIVICA